MNDQPAAMLAAKIVVPVQLQRPRLVGFYNRWDDGHYELVFQQVARVQFLGGMLTCETDEDLWLDVAYACADFPRDVRMQCAFCHGDPCAERSSPESLIAREYQAWQDCKWNSKRDGFACPCCDGRPT